MIPKSTLVSSQGSYNIIISGLTCPCSPRMILPLSMVRIITEMHDKLIF